MKNVKVLGDTGSTEIYIPTTSLVEKIWFWNTIQVSC